MYAAAQEALRFIWLLEGDLWIVYEDCWHGVQIVLKEMHRGMIPFPFYIQISISVTHANSFTPTVVYFYVDVCTILFVSSIQPP